MCFVLLCYDCSLENQILKFKPVYFKKKSKLNTLMKFTKKYTYSQLEGRPKNLMAITEPLSFVSETVFAPYRISFILLFWSTITPELSVK